MHSRPKSCEGCLLHATATGFMPRAETHPGARLLLLGEALGQAEARSGKPFQGGAGLSMFSLLAQEGLAREDFLIENSLRCFPPGHLAKYPVGQKMAAVDHCRQYSDVTLKERQPKVVLALGGTALWRMSGGDWPNIDQRRGYFEWSEQYGCWVGATYHPAFLMRGHWNLAAAWLYDIRRALEVAKGGYTQAWPAVWEDPPAHDFIAWVSEIKPFLTPTADLYLDIETPHKSQMGEDELAIWGEEAILRISFAFGSWPAVSVPWQPPYLESIRALLESEATKWIWNKNFDERKLAAAGYPLSGAVADAMSAWHSLHPTLPKGLGYVAPFFYPNLPRWKHLAGDRPAFYSAIDSEVLRGINTAVVEQLKRHKLWTFHVQHVLELDPELKSMTRLGLPIDPERRKAAALKLTPELERLREEMEKVVPTGVRQLHPKQGYVRDPEDTTGLVTLVVEAKVKRCGRCLAPGVLKPHVGKKTLSGRGKTAVLNPCYGVAIVEGPEPVTRWAKQVPFAPSNNAMKRYAAALGHEMVKATGKDLQEGEEKWTFDEKALKQLSRAYPKDQLYPLVLDYRKIEKLLGYVGILQEDGTFKGGFPVHEDGAIHPVYNANPYTMRLATQEPNGNQLPRPEDEWSSLIRGCVVAPEGHVIGEVDFSGIEAVMVGYFAGSERYVRLCRLGVHDFVTCHAARRRGLWSEEPKLEWSDADLKALFKEAKKRFQPVRQVCKKGVHSGAYGITPKGLYLREPETFTSAKEAEEILSLIYDELFPELRKWQWSTLREAKNKKHLDTPFGNKARFWRPLKWSKNKQTGQWEEKWGEQAEETLAFRPQSTAAGILKRALINLRRESPSIADMVRLFNHDSLVFISPTWLKTFAMSEVMRIMEREIPELPLPWKPSECLRIGVEGKTGFDWAEMEEWHPTTTTTAYAS